VATELTDQLKSSSIDWNGSRVERPQAFARFPLLLGGALMATVLYAAFDHGSVSLAASARVEVALAVITAAATVGLAVGALHFRASGSALLGLGLLAGFACWSGITVLWSVAPDQTWVELNRGLAYVLVVGLAIALGATHPRAPALLARGFFAVAVIVSAYALGQKLVPGLHLAGIVDLNQTGSIPRLQEPIGYWNALALFVVLGVPVGLRLTTDRTRSPHRRLLAAGGLELMLLTIGLTLSRGGLLALAAAIVVVVAGATERLRALAWLALVALATVPPLALGLTLHSLADAGVTLARRETGGGILAGGLVLSVAALYVAGRVLLAYEPRLVLAPGHERWVRRGGLAGLAVLIAGALLAAILTHAWHNFTSPSAPSNVNPSRLLTTDSYRWLWWKEAASAFAARPVGGWGAGSFGVVHLIYRHNTLPVQQPHSVPLQFLSETGVVGALLGLGGLVLLLLAAVRSVRRRGLIESERGTSPALVAAGIAYAVHCLYDWDWNIPAVTLPALLFIGVLAGAERRSADAAADGDKLREAPGLGTRVVALTAATLWLCLFASSAILPSLAASRAQAALVDASNSSATVLTAAASKARSASSLDPLSDTGLRAEASISLHRGELTRARYDLEAALGREPSDELAWNQLAVVDLFLGDRGGARLAARRVVEIDPRGATAQALRRSGLLSPLS
jgi:O-antigen ligase/polysaccharide polymerase Wzy-like membrane protein